MNFYDWLLLLGMLSGFIHIVACIISTSFFFNDRIILFGYTWIYLFISWWKLHLGYFQGLIVILGPILRYHNSKKWKPSPLNLIKGGLTVRLCRQFNGYPKVKKEVQQLPVGTDPGAKSQEPRQLLLCVWGLLESSLGSASLCMSAVVCI